MLEIACVLSLAVEDFVDFSIIAAMLVCNGYLGFYEELKAKESLVCSLIYIEVKSFRMYVLIISLG
jgi:hypothetical protein